MFECQLHAGILHVLKSTLVAISLILFDFLFILRLVLHRGGFSRGTLLLNKP